MKKLFLILVLSVLFSGNAFAGVNEPGVTSIAGCDKSLKYQFKKIKKNIQKNLKKKNKLLFFMQVVIMTNIPGQPIKVKI